MKEIGAAGATFFSPALTTLIAWATPTMVALHLIAYDWIMRVAPQMLCTFHGPYERVCGKGHWDRWIELAALAELLIAGACLYGSILLISQGKLTLMGRIGLVVSCVVAALFLALFIYA